MTSAKEGSTELDLTAILIAKYNKQVEKSALRIMHLKKQVEILKDTLKDTLEDAYDANCGCTFLSDPSRGYPQDPCEAHKIISEGLRLFNETIPNPNPVEEQK